MSIPLNQANTLRELIEVLQRLEKELGPDAIWWGWDDGSMFLSSKDKTIQLYVDPDPACDR